MTVAPLCNVLKRVKDPRDPRGVRFELNAILMLVCAAMLCGYDSPNQIAIWGQAQGRDFLKALGFKRSICIGKSALYAVLSDIDVEHLEQLLAVWVAGLLQELGCPADQLAIALDGKTLRGSKKQGAAVAHLLSAVSHGVGLTLYQVGVDGQTNEITMVQTLLKGLLIEGRVFTMDALLTQREIAETIVNEGGDYFMIAKGNQAALQADIALYFEADTTPVAQTTTVELGHGRIERRTLYTTEALNDYLDWPAVGQAGVIERVRIEKKSGQVLSQERHLFVTSLPAERAGPERLLEISRGHWTIENKSHYVRDVSFHEDASQVRKGSLPQVMAAFRNLTLTVLRRAGHTRIREAFIRNAAQPLNALGFLLM